jgi:hypothetical protein
MELLPMSETPITLITPGPIPGIPGDHGPGSYLVDYDAEPRTIRPAPVEDNENEEDTSGTTEPLPNLSADLAKGEVDDSSTSTPSETPEQPAQNEDVSQADQQAQSEQQAPVETTQTTSTPDVATEILHIEDELKTLSAEQQHQG